MNVSDFQFGLTDANETFVQGLVNLYGTPPVPNAKVNLNVDAEQMSLMAGAGCSTTYRDSRAVAESRHRPSGSFLATE